jgi:hypothetical protein
MPFLCFVRYLYPRNTTVIESGLTFWHAPFCAWPFVPYYHTTILVTFCDEPHVLSRFGDAGYVLSRLLSFLSKMTPATWTMMRILWLFPLYHCCGNQFCSCQGGVVVVHYNLVAMCCWYRWSPPSSTFQTSVDGYMQRSWHCSWWGWRMAMSMALRNLNLMRALPKEQRS